MTRADLGRWDRSALDRPPADRRKGRRPAEGDSTIHYKLSKQPDVLMLFYLFSAGELRLLFEWLGYPFDDQTIPKNISYYYPRSAHDSSLSRVADSSVLARADRPGSWDVFTEALVTASRACPSPFGACVCSCAIGANRSPSNWKATPSP